MVPAMASAQTSPTVPLSDPRVVSLSDQELVDDLSGRVLQQHEGVYRRFWSRPLADSRLLVLGVGELGTAVVERLRPFETGIARVASRVPDVLRLTCWNSASGN